MAAIAAVVSAKVLAAAAAAVVAATAVAAAGTAGKLASDSTCTAEAGCSCRPVMGQWEEAARPLGLRWTTSGAQLYMSQQGCS